MAGWGTTLSYTFRGARRGLARAPWLHVMTLATIVTCTLLAMTVTLGWRNIYEAVVAQEQRAASAPISVSISSARTSGALSRERLVQELRQLPEVARIEQGHSNAEMSSPTLAIYVQRDAEPEFAARLARYLEGRAGVTTSIAWDTGAGRVDARAIALGLVVFAVLAAWLMIGSVLRLTVFARRRELIVLEELGATRGLMCAPHVVLAFSHCVLGFLGASLALYGLFVAFAVDGAALLAGVLGMEFVPRFFASAELLTALVLVVALGVWSARSAVAHALRA
jgi:cell division protein FtsX